MGRRPQIPPPRTTSRRQFLASAVAVLSTAACTGGVPRVGPTPAAGAATVAPTRTASELAVGLVLSLTGRFSREGALLRAGYETWVDAVAHAGGIRLGTGRRTVRLVLADDQSEPSIAGRQFERLASTERIGLWLGPFTTAMTTAVATVAERSGALVVAPDASAVSLYRRGFGGLVSILPPEDRLLHGLADLAATASPRAQPVGILIADEPSNAAAAAGFRERATSLGLGPVRVELTALGSHDISAPLERLAEDAPRCLIVATESGQTERFTPSIRELLPFSTMRVLLPLPAPIAPGARRHLIYDGMLTVESWWPSIAASGPVLGSALDFVERFRRLHGYEPEPRCATAAAAGLALQLAIEQAGSDESKAVRQAFSTLDVTTFWGRMAWDPAGRNRAAVSPVLQQQGNGLVTVYPPERAGGQLRYPLAGWPRD